jgi:hypothetical protein
MSLTRTLNRLVAKATYDPELEKQLAEENKKAREVRANLRNSINALKARDREYIANGTLTSMGATQTTALFKTIDDWLAATPDATSSEVEDKGNELLDKLANIYNQDKDRAFFLNNLKVTDMILTLLKTNNVISEDVYNKSKKIIDDENKWFEKNPNENLQVYKDRIQKMGEEVNKVINDPEAFKKLRDAQNGVKVTDNSKDLDAQRKKVEEQAKQKEELQKQQFDAKRFFAKISGSFFTAIIIAVIVSVALVGGSLAANEAIVRPLAYRALFFFYGMIFSPFVIIYFMYRYFTGHPPYFGAYLFPLYAYDPTVEQKDTFIQRLFWYKSNPIVTHATETFQKAADAGKELQMNFSGIAAQIVK